MAAPGVTDLAELIRSMTPILDETTTYVFVNFNSSSLQSTNLADPSYVDAIQMLFREDEGWTGIVQQSFAEEKQLDSMFPCRRITLKVYSSLDAVGFLAAVTKRLKELNIGVNPVSACLHDHLFVPIGTETAVMEALQSMARGHGDDELGSRERVS